jgi:hypothetical protein
MARARTAAANYIAAHYRHTSLGGLTIPVAVRRVDGMITIVPPVSKHYSRSGAHGVFYYPGDVDAIIYLDRSNSGHRSVFVRCLTNDADFCSAIKRCANTLWVARGLSPRDVAAALLSCR